MPVGKSVQTVAPSLVRIMNGYTEADRKNMVFYGIAADLCKMIKKGASEN